VRDLPSLSFSRYRTVSHPSKQDSIDDWAKESAAMGDYYLGSSLNISATGASDSMGGCFVDRVSELVEPCIERFRSYKLGQRLSFTYQVFDISTWNTETSSTHAFRRGWIFQERLLSPRVLHFGQSQVLWECRECTACETLPDQVQHTTATQGVRSGVNLTKNCLSYILRINAGLEIRPKTQDILANWATLVDYYSRTRLSKPEDKLPAFSGMAKEFQHALVKVSSSTVQYLAGRWSIHLAQQLGWECMPGSPRSRPINYRAPSWSWAAVDGEVVCDRSSSMKEPLQWPRLSVDGKFIFEQRNAIEDSYVEVLDTNIQLLTGDITGQVVRGHILLRGPLRRIELRFISSVILSVPMTEFDQVSIAIDEHEIHGQVNLDEPLNLEGKALFCLPLGSSVIPGLVLKPALLLTPTGKESEYKRLGLITIWIEDPEDLRSMNKIFRSPYAVQWPEYRCFDDVMQDYTFRLV
jgi:hypothetical protein